MPTALAAGQLVDERYALDHELDEDAFGTTWEAFDRGLGRSVRLRDLTFPGVGRHDPRLRQALKAARTAIRLHHPGAVHVYDAFLDDDRLVVVTELTYAPTLAAAVRRKRLGDKRAAAVGFEMLDPLAAAHATGLVHGSIAPRAVLVPDKARSLLSGFGLAPPFTDALDLDLAAAVGTLECLAPEQVALTGTTPASDLWSLGATLYFAVEGEHAFATPEAIAHDAPRAPSRARRLWPVLERLLAKDPEARPSIDELGRDLAAVAGIRLDADGRPITAGRRSRRARRRAEEASLAPPEGEAGIEEADAPVASGPKAKAAPVAEVSDREWEAILQRPASEAWVEWSPRGDGATTDEEAAAAEAAPVAAIAPTPEEEEEERVYRSTPSWPPSQPHRSLFLVLLCVWVTLVMVGLLVTNGQFGQPEADEGGPSANRPELTTDPAAVPGDWVAYRHPVVDFGISHPPDWRLRQEGPLLTITDPATGTELRVDARTPPTSDPDRWVLEAERNFSIRHPQDYRRLQMSPASYLGHPATLWEYSYQERGSTAHTAELVFTTEKYLFTMVFHAADDRWQATLPTFRGFLSSVRAPN